LIAALALTFALAAITPTLGSIQKQSLVAKSTFPVRTAKAAKRIAKRAKAIANEALTAANLAQATADTAKQLAGTAQAAADAAQNSANLAKSAADAAQGSAGQAKSAADAAQGSANQAQSSANQAQNSADQAQASADANAAELLALRAKTDTDAPTVTTTEENTYVDLGGPSVTVNVPQSGLIEVWAQITTVDGAVSLYEDGGQVPDQDPNDLCSGPGGVSPPSGVLLSAAGIGPPPFTVSTPGNAGLGPCGSTSAPGPELFHTSPGLHTYDLRYASCGCNAPDPAEFTDRMLTVAPRP
jgi:multidrug efflux pump subunit AcrA (membrane-fusion protein)